MEIDEIVEEKIEQEVSNEDNVDTEQLKKDLLARKESVFYKRVELNSLYAENKISVKEFKERRAILGKEENEINQLLSKIKQ